MPKQKRNKSSFGAKTAFDIWSSSKKNKSRRELGIRVGIYVDKACDRELLEGLKTTFLPESTTATLAVYLLSKEVLVSGLDLVVIVPSFESAHLAEGLAERASAQHIPTIVVLESAAEGLFQNGALPEGTELCFVSSGASLAPVLADVVCDVVEDKDLALAAAFPAFREAMSRKLIHEAASSNAVVGAVDIIHGADLPIMLVNELKLALDIALIHGKDVDMRRVPELALTVIFAFIYRQLARTSTRVFPKAGFAVRAALAYGGTKLTGEALLALHRVPEADIEAFIQNYIEPVYRQAEGVVKEALSTLMEKLRAAQKGEVVERDYRPIAVFEDVR